MKSRYGAGNLLSVSESLKHQISPGQASLQKPQGEPLKLLIIDSSPRTARSRSRSLAKYFAEIWARQFPEDELKMRDLGEESPDHISEEWMQAAYTPPEKRTARMHNLLSTSDECVIELQQANYLVLACPMYNFSIPSSLKAYIDQIFRLGETFRLDQGRYVGLLNGTKAFVICAKGGLYKETEQADFSTPYLDYILKILGYRNVVSIDAEGLDLSKDHEKDGLKNAQETIRNLIQTTAGERNA